jgi:hypothetical protein
MILIPRTIEPSSERIPRRLRRGQASESQKTSFFAEEIPCSVLQAASIRRKESHKDLSGAASDRAAAVREDHAFERAVFADPFIRFP